MKLNIKQFGLVLVCLIMTLAACNKMIQVDTPLNQLTPDKVFSDSSAAIAALLNVYSMFDGSIDASLTISMSNYSDELIYPSHPDDEFLLSAVSPDNGANLNIWKRLYAAVYACNDIIKQLKNTTALSLSNANELSSEARFLRAYSYFYLVNLYGAVPLILETDVNKTATASQVSSEEVYNQIIADLEAAVKYLPESYRGGGKVRANKFAAKAMLARVNLYLGNWQTAIASADDVINSGLYTPLPNAGEVFSANSRGGILQFWTQFGYVSEGPLLVPSSGMPRYPLTNSLINSFESGDNRKKEWVDTVSVPSGDSLQIFYYPYKYKNRDNNTASPEYLMALRIGEVFLIRAEAKVESNDLDGGLADLNLIRTRAGLPGSAATTKMDLLYAIIHERQVELFCEWGQRFLDLKRTGRLNSALSYKDSWKDASALLPIPQNELTYDPNLKQNKGY